MNYTELINSKFAKENIGVISYCCGWNFFGEFIALLSLIGIDVWLFTSFPIESEEIIYAIFAALLPVFAVLVIYIDCVLAIKMRKDLKNEDIVFEKVIIEKIDSVKYKSKYGASYFYWDKKHHKQFGSLYIICFYDHYGNKRKLYMLMSAAKYLKINRTFNEVEVKKEFPVYYLRTSGVILAIMDEDAPSQERLWYKMLNCEI